MREVKIPALHEQKKLRVMIVDLLQKGIAATETQRRKIPKPIKLRGGCPEAPVLCAMETSKALKSHPGLHMRMGIRSGPVNEISDLNEQANIAGAGINIVQRVMDCGDAGHILLSRYVAEDLEQYPR